MRHHIVAALMHLHGCLGKARFIAVKRRQGEEAGEIERKAEQDEGQDRPLLDAGNEIHAGTRLQPGRRGKIRPLMP